MSMFRKKLSRQAFDFQHHLRQPIAGRVFNNMAGVSQICPRLCAIAQDVRMSTWVIPIDWNSSRSPA